MTMTAFGERLRRYSRGDVRAAAIVVPFLLLFFALAVFSPPFLTPANLLNILDQQAAVLIIAAAGTLVLVAGGIDLSVGAVAALAAVVAATVAQEAGALVGISAGLLIGLVSGLANGVIVTVFRINSLIATLAMSFLLAGLAAMVSGGTLIVLFDVEGFDALARTNILGVRSSTWIMLLAAALIGLLLARTVAGRYIYAVGGSSDAASLAGVPVRAVRLGTFMLSGGAAGLGGVLIASRTLSAQATSGQELTFTVLAGIVVGGTSIAGGEGAVWRTVGGVLFIALIGNGFNLLGLDPLYRQVALGAIILLAVGIDAALRSGRR
jgi:ribose transport system permease protein